MSRSGYSDDLDNWSLIRWRGAVTAAIRGKRGQAFLREMLAALDAMPMKRLIAHDLERDGAVCALGSVGAARGMDMAGIDTYDRMAVADAFGISEAMAAEVAFVNDDDFCCGGEKDEQRWRRVRQWVVEQLAERSKP